MTALSCFKDHSSQADYPPPLFLLRVWKLKQNGAVSADHLLARATEAVRRHLGHCVAPSWSNVALHRDCIPQYHLGHFQRVGESFIKNNNLLLSLIGSAYDGVSVNDVIFSGRTAVAELLGDGA
uniref:Amine oxidase domain-containing protein n=1 Tax=Poecilia mexicana TaxID=48701 RepID=A0A3B3X0R2_9TELE